jgi:hypothetical protein
VIRLKQIPALPVPGHFTPDVPVKKPNPAPVLMLKVQDHETVILRFAPDHNVAPESEMPDNVRAKAKCGFFLRFPPSKSRWVLDPSVE